MRLLLIVLGILLLLIPVGIGVYGYVIGYQYESKIGSYFDNARDSITPEVMLEQLQNGRQAMVSEGLTEDLYGAWIFKKPDNSMKFQYQHLDGIIERVKAVQQWKTKMYANDSINSETMKDVYNEKMDNLRNYISGETSDSIVGTRSDWISKDTWWLKNHFFLDIFGVWIFLLGFVLAIIFIWVGFAIDDSSEVTSTPW